MLVKRCVTPGAVVLVIAISGMSSLPSAVLMTLAIIHEPLPMLYTPFAMYVGIVYSYLPFLILPLYANLEKMDWQLLEAAKDLGCRPWQAFYKITLPLFRPAKG